jgi:trimeric autotransporter adhesin
LANTTGAGNTANGYQALQNNASGFGNTATGINALLSNTTGNNNAASGRHALYNNTTGSNNIALGTNGGSNLTTGSKNIDIGNQGIAGESSAIRIGTAGAQTGTFIAGIRGTTTANGNAVPVVIDSAGQLGTVSSSQRFKDNIQPMHSESEAIMALKPVTFHYKSDKQSTPQFGLIAEEVAKVNPDLVVRDDNGQIYTVRYEAVNAMLLNEFLKEHRNVAEQQTTIAELKTTVAQQQKQIAALTATVQKVSEKIELNKTTPQLVADLR